MKIEECIHPANKLVFDEEKGEIICSSCSLILQDRIERDMYKDLRIGIDELDKSKEDYADIRQNEGHIHPLNKRLTLGTIYMGGMHLDDDGIYQGILKKQARLIRLDQRCKYNMKDIALYRLISIYSNRLNIPTWYLYDLLLECKRVTKGQGYVRAFKNRLKQRYARSDRYKELSQLIDDIYEVNYAVYIRLYKKGRKTKE